jgi:hypothetical protein
VDLDFVGVCSIDDRWKLPVHVIDEAIQVAPDPGADGAHFLPDAGTALLDGARLTRKVTLDQLDSPAELFAGHRRRAPPRIDALAEHACSIDPFTEGVIEEDPAPLLRQKARQMIEQPMQPAAFAIPFERPLA